MGQVDALAAELARRELAVPTQHMERHHVREAAERVERRQRQSCEKAEDVSHRQRRVRHECARVKAGA